MPAPKLVAILMVVVMGLQACQQQPPETFGALTATEADLTNASLDSLEVQGSTIQIDSVTTGNISYIQFGKVNHPWFGNLETRSVVEIRPNSGANLEPIQTVDSVMLSMTLNRLSGDTTQPLVIDIFQADSVPQYTTSYRSLRPINYLRNTNPIASFTVQNTGYRTEATTKIKVNVSYQLAGLIKLNSDSLDYTNPDKFSRQLRGLVFVPRTGNQIVTVDMSTYSLVLYYKNTDGLSKVYFFNYGLASGHFTQVISSRAGSPFESLNRTGAIMPANSANDSSVLIQGGSGLRALLKIPTLTSYYNQLTSRLGKIIVLKAELVMPTQISTIANFNNKPYLYYLLQGSAIDRPSEFIYNDNRRGLASGYSQFNFASTDQLLKADITTYIQKVFRGNYQNQGILFYLGESDITTSFVRLKASSGNNGIRLKIYYIKQP
jgi:hypothetical protein